ncbi:hypothetical protein FA15DRAFT_263906 [Coprinopsis marcescibilis]|uniref:Uncharacterized protein n=1 Tax=Coprinopsis marcescibilis TaxID=230819 RepID=A0A5C3L1R2_COPMA|nr:hypothetical protein FA15DRAFT_263906 [Coprinopsis marcescibilis]
MSPLYLTLHIHTMVWQSTLLVSFSIYECLLLLLLYDIGSETVDTLVSAQPRPIHIIARITYVTA